jgi:outer membrane protein assembly factor BamA
MGSVETGVGTWTDNPVRVHAEVLHRNLFSHGWGGGLEGAYATYEQNITGRVWANSLLRVRSRAMLHATYETEDEAAYYLINREVGLSSLFHTLGQVSWRVGVTFSNANVNAPDKGFESIPYDDGQQLTFEVSWYLDAADDPLDPTSGHRLTVAGAWAPSWENIDWGITDSPFWSVRGTVTRYLALRGDRTILALRGDLGYGRPIGANEYLLPNRRFFSGGFNTMRGYGRRELGPVDADGDPLGGEARVLAGAEIRQNVWKALGAVVFLDTGQVWAHIQDVNLGNYQYAIGLGPVVRTPVGPLSVVRAYNLAAVPAERARGVWHLGIGNAF